METSSETFGQRVRQLIRDYPTADRGPEFIAHVMASIDPSEYKDFLTQALTTVIPVYDNELRRSAFRAALREEAQAQVESGAHVSQRVEAAGGYWQKLLRTSIVTETGRKFLAQCTAEDMMFAARMKREHAAATINDAERDERLADLVTEYGVDTVGALPESAWSGFLAP